MKLLFKIFLLTMLVSKTFGQDKENLYPIMKGDRWGYIDKTGKMVIKPKFIEALKFSEGLAAVRVNGTYGYIDKTGTFAIPPKYDIAYVFKNGLAKVYIDGKPFIIDKKGTILFQHNYKEMQPFGNKSFTQVTTETDKQGLIDKSGKLIVDTVFARINTFTNGVAVVRGLKDNKHSDEDSETKIYEQGVIDSLGHWIVNYGKYQRIDNFKNGYAEVVLIEDDPNGDDQGFIDLKGNHRFTVPSKKWLMESGNDTFHQDIASISIYSVNRDTIKTWSSDKRYDFAGAINSKGELLFSNRDWDKITPFTFNRAFAQVYKGKWFLIDTQGKTVTSQSFDQILYETYNGEPEYLFQNGIAFVKTSNGWGAIDINGKFVIEPNYLKNWDHGHLIRRGNIIFMQEDISVQSDNYSYRYGFWNTTNNLIVKPQFHDIEYGFKNDLIYVMQDGITGYIDRSGKQVWKNDDKNSSKQLNIDFMNRGYYYAASERKKELEGYGGWGGSNNSSKKVNSVVSFSPNTLQIILNPKQKTKWADKYDGIKLIVANTSKDSLFFDAQDSRLYLNIQAQDKNGKWKDIEYLPSSWCGNSYHTLFLASNELWEFATPVYQGEFKTKLRAKLAYKKNIEQEEPDYIYSNEIEGFVNPGQFWNQRDYSSRGLMDPYNN